MNTVTGRSQRTSIKVLFYEDAEPTNLIAVEQEVKRKFDAWLERRGFAKPVKPFQANSLFPKYKK